MLNLYVRGRKRRVWSPATIAVSVGAHLLLLAGVVSTAVGTPDAPTDEKIDEWVLNDPPAPKPKIVTPPIPVEKNDPPPAPKPDQPKPVPGDFVTPKPPTTVPTEIPAVNPTETPITADDVTGIGQEGDVIGPPPEKAQPLTGNTVPDGTGDGPIDVRLVEELPELANRSQAERLFRQNYPPLLRESGTTGRTMVTMIIDAEGKVEPGSVTVQETTHEAFRAAAIRVAEKLRFRPARLNERPVSVIIAIPIEWKLDN